MTRAYRIGFWVVGLYFGVGVVTETMLDGKIYLPGLIPILAGVALYKDWEVRQSVSAMASR